MKKLGILGGLGPLSSELYYREINRQIYARTDGYPEIILHSVPLQEVIRLIEANDEIAYIAYLSSILDRLVAAGAEVIGIASNTPHAIFEPLAEACSVPIISVVDAAAAHAKRMAWDKLLLLGTGFTMSGTFFQRGFAKQGMGLILPSEENKEWLHQTIITEIEHGIVTDATQDRLGQIVLDAKTDGADAVILGCTELGDMWDSSRAALPELDTAAVHIEALISAVLDMG